MSKHSGVISIAPLKKPVNAFRLLLQQLNKGKYPTVEAARKAKQQARLLEYLYKQPIPAHSDQPVQLLALARLATDGAWRKQVMTVCRLIEEEYARVGERIPQEARTPNNGSNGGGFSIDDIDDDDGAGLNI